MARRSRENASALEMPRTTSVRGPTSSPGTPSRTAASSSRSSASPTVKPRMESSRTASRSTVVFPPPGGDRRIPPRGYPSAISRRTTSAAQPGQALATRIHKEAISARRVRPPSAWNRPATPARQPPGSVKYPCPSSSSHAYGENFSIPATIPRSSTGVILSASTSTPPCHSAVIAPPARRRTFSTRFRLPASSNASPARRGR